MFEDFENAGTLAYLYKFEGVDGVTYRYTNADTDFEDILGNLYLATPITHEGYSSTADIENTQIKITMDVEDSFVKDYRGFPPEGIVAFTLSNVYVEDPDKEILDIWVGNHTSTQWREDEGLADLTCDLISLGFKRSGLRRRYGLSCPFILYGGMCQASASFGEATVSNIDGKTLEVTSGWMPVGWPTIKKQYANFNNGFISYQLTVSGTLITRNRSIVEAQSDNSFLLSSTPIGLNTGDTVKIHHGCARTIAHCRDLHDNINRYGGQPYMPIDNPFTTTKFY